MHISTHPFMYFSLLVWSWVRKGCKTPLAKTKFPTSQVIDNYCGFVWGGKVDGRGLLCGTVYWTLILSLLVWIYAVCCLASHDNTISFKNQEITEFHTKTNFTDIIHDSLRSIIGKHSIHFHCSADVTQLYLFTKPNGTHQLVKPQDIKAWIPSNFLPLNSDKTINVLSSRNLRNMTIYSQGKNYLKPCWFCLLIQK